MSLFTIMAPSHWDTLENIPKREKEKKKTINAI